MSRVFRSSSVALSATIAPCPKTACRYGRTLAAHLWVALALGALQAALAVPALAQSRPNIVFVLADDLDYAPVSAMPQVASLAAAGVTFTNAYANVPLCGPSRATILTGRYAHNTRVLRNAGENGGFVAFHRNGSERSTIATWLLAAGYRTALFGKYINRYPDTVASTFVPPGWTDWAVPVPGGVAGGYMLNENGTLVSHGTSPSDYFTDVIRDKAIEFISSSVAAKDPFFLVLAPTAPHAPATPAARHAQLFADKAAPRTRSFNEANISDKPPFLRLPVLSASQIAEMDALYRNRLRSLQAVDEAVRAIYRRVETLGRLGNTYFVFSSDNGFHLGQHRLTDGKGTAYHEDLHVPLIVRGPGIPRGLVVDWLATLADLAPTFAAWAGVAPGGPVDGRSLVPVLGTAPPALWRQSLPISYWSSPKFVGVRTLGHSYARYPAFGARELYDMRNDSEQLRNVSGTASASLMTRLDRLTSDLAACAGAACVARENAAAP